MQYQLLGVSSGFSAHMLSTLLVSWRRMLRAAAIAGALGVAAVEAFAVATSHQFPPTLPTNAVAVALGIAVAYSAAASIFARELLRGALRALTLLQDGAGALMGATAVAARPAEPRTASATPLPLRTSQTAMTGNGVARTLEDDPLRSRFQPHAALPSVEHAQVMRDQAAELRRSVSQPAPSEFPAGPRWAPRMTPAGAISQPYRFIEDEPTRPVTIGEEDGATVMVLPALPEAHVFSPQAGPASRVAPFAPPESQIEAARPLPAGVSVPLPPLAQASPPPDLYAPWSEVTPIADPSARTELGTIAAQDSALNARGVQAAIARGRWPRRVLRPFGSGHRHGWGSPRRGRTAGTAR